MYYTGGTYDEFLKKNNMNHVIVIVGWDDDKQAFLIKNSRGEGWGAKGYMWIRYGSNGIGWGSTWAVMKNSNALILAAADNQKEIRVKTGDIIELALGTQPSTGYSRQIASLSCVEKSGDSRAMGRVETVHLGP